MRLPAKIKFERATHPDWLPAEGYPVGPLVCSKINNEWGLLHTETGMLFFYYPTLARAMAEANKCAHWPIWSKVTRKSKRSSPGDISQPEDFGKKLYALARKYRLEFGRRDNPS